MSTKLRYNSHFVTCLNEQFNFVEPQEIDDYLKFHITFLTDSKSTMVSHQLRLRKLILDMLTGLEFNVEQSHKETGERSIGRVVAGKMLVDDLKKTKWDDDSILGALIAWNENIDELLEDPSSFSSDEFLRKGAKNSMIIKLHLKELARYFIQNDILKQLIKQL